MEKIIAFILSIIVQVPVWSQVDVFEKELMAYKLKKEEAVLELVHKKLGSLPKTIKVKGIPYCFFRVNQNISDAGNFNVMKNLEIDSNGFLGLVYIKEELKYIYLNSFGNDEELKSIPSDTSSFHHETLFPFISFLQSKSNMPFFIYFSQDKSRWENIAGFVDNKKIVFADDSLDTYSFPQIIDRNFGSLAKFNDELNERNLLSGVYKKFEISTLNGSKDIKKYDWVAYRQYYPSDTAVIVRKFMASVDLILHQSPSEKKFLLKQVRKYLFITKLPFVNSFEQALYFSLSREQYCYYQQFAGYFSKVQSSATKNLYNAFNKKGMDQLEVTQQLKQCLMAE